MKYGKRMVQINHLVIDTYDMLSTDDMDYESTFKYQSQEKSFGHGKYTVFKKPYLFADESNISMTMTLGMKKLPCEKRLYYRNFAITELSKPGRIWAVQNNGLVWAYAAASSINEVSSEEEKLQFNVDFHLWEGVWHKADLQKTFLKPYDPCLFMDCLNYKTLHPCCGESCMECSEVQNGDKCNQCCECDALYKDWALCYHLDELQNYYDTCKNAFYIEYSCEKAQEFFGDYYLGQKICNKCDSEVIAGQVYADTDIPTAGNIILHGKYLNPIIEINGNVNQIKGDYTDHDITMTITKEGDVYVRDEDDCCDDGDPLSPDHWVIPEGNDYGWEFVPGNNRIIVETGQCCGTNCIYIQIDGITL